MFTRHLLMISRVWVSINLFPGAGSLHWACTLWLLGNFPKRTVMNCVPFIPFFTNEMIPRPRDQTFPNLFNGLQDRWSESTQGRWIRGSVIHPGMLNVWLLARLLRWQDSRQGVCDGRRSDGPNYPPDTLHLHPHHLLSCLIYFNLCRRSLTVDTSGF